MGQLTALGTSKNTANFEETDVLRALVKVVPKRLQEPRQQARPHPGSVFQNGIA